MNTEDQIIELTVEGKLTPSTKRQKHYSDDLKGSLNRLPTQRLDRLFERSRRQYLFK